MNFSSKARVFAKKRGYHIKELCTNRYELKKEYEIMDINAHIEEGTKKIKVTSSPKVIPLLAASAILFAAFFPLVALVYVFYGIMSHIRINSIKKDFNGIKW